MIARPVQPRQRRAGNRSGVVMEAHQRIELVLGRGLIAQRAGDIAGITYQIAGEPGIALADLFA